MGNHVTAMVPWSSPGNLPAAGVTRSSIDIDMVQPILVCQYSLHRVHTFIPSDLVKYSSLCLNITAVAIVEKRMGLRFNQFTRFKMGKE
jgi:hypothetical protein